MTELTKVTKLDALRRQLLAAIHMHWYLNEPIATYTLAANAWEIGDALLRRAGKRAFRESVAANSAMSEIDVKDLINKFRNFVKHADRDPESAVDEELPVQIDTVLMAAAIDYWQLNVRVPVPVEAMLTWYSAIYPEKTGDFRRSEADSLFSGLANQARPDQIRAARRELHRMTNDPRQQHFELSDNHRWRELREKFGPN